MATSCVFMSCLYTERVPYKVHQIIEISLNNSTPPPTHKPLIHTHTKSWEALCNSGVKITEFGRHLLTCIR